MNAAGIKSGRSIAPTKPVRVDPDEQVWRQLLEHMRQTQPQICRQWFEEIEPLGINGGVLYLRAHSTVHRDYLQRSCLGPFNDSAQTASGRLISVRFLGPDEQLPADAAAARREAEAALALTKANLAEAASVHTHTPPPPTAHASAAESLTSSPVPVIEVIVNRSHEQVPAEIPSSAKVDLPANFEHLYDDGLVLNPDYGFDHFVVGPSNRLAHAAALAVAANPGRAYNPYFVHGGVGLGKTHLLQAICLAIRAQRPEAVIYYTSCEGFMTQFMDAVAAGAMTRFRHKFRHVDVLVIDDIHFLAKRDRTQEEFFHTFNSLYQSHKQIVLSSDGAPEEIPDLEDRLVSRFKWGLVAQLTPPCYETRVEILKGKSKIRGLTLPDDVACYLAAKIDSNIRELEGAIVKLQVYANVEKRPIDMEIARLCFNDHDTGKAEPKIQIQTIITAVTDYFGVKVTDLQSKRRQRSIAQPRQLCMYLARRHTRYSLEEIGGYFGGRDHTTVMHAVKTIEDRRETEADFNAVVKTLEEKLRAPM